MTEWLRQAGRGRLPTGATVAWSVAEGARGRRWRWTVADGGTLGSSALIELAADGRFARLELATADAMLTFHPDRGGAEAHGNVIRVTGVEPIAVPWQSGWGIGFADDAFGSTLGAWRGAGLVLRSGSAWSVGSAALVTLPVDGRGIPRLGSAEEWALEV